MVQITCLQSPRSPYRSHAEDYTAQKCGPRSSRIDLATGSFKVRQHRSTWLWSSQVPCSPRFRIKNYPCSWPVNIPVVIHQPRVDCFKKCRVLWFYEQFSSEDQHSPTGENGEMRLGRRGLALDLRSLSICCLIRIQCRCPLPQGHGIPVFGPPAGITTYRNQQSDSPGPETIDREVVSSNT